MFWHWKEQHKSGATSNIKYKFLVLVVYLHLVTKAHKYLVITWLSYLLDQTNIDEMQIVMSL